jgi:hypothetical protein
MILTVTIPDSNCNFFNDGDVTDDDGDFEDDTNDDDYGDDDDDDDDVDVDDDVDRYDVQFSMLLINM